MKLYRGKWKYARWHYKGGTLRLFKWALALKPGDYFAACIGYNLKIEKIQISWDNDGEWRYERMNRHWFIDDIALYSAGGYVHYVNSRGCALPAESIETIMENHRMWAEEYGDEMPKIKAALDAGIPILDEHGTLLPGFSSRK